MGTHSRAPGLGSRPFSPCLDQSSASGHGVRCLRPCSTHGLSPGTCRRETGCWEANGGREARVGVSGPQVGWSGAHAPGVTPVLRTYSPPRTPGIPGFPWKPVALGVDTTVFPLTLAFPRLKLRHGRSSFLHSTARQRSRFGTQTAGRTRTSATVTRSPGGGGSPGPSPRRGPAKPQLRAGGRHGLLHLRTSPPRAGGGRQRGPWDSRSTSAAGSLPEDAGRRARGRRRGRRRDFPAGTPNGAARYSRLRLQTSNRLVSPRRTATGRTPRCSRAVSTVSWTGLFDRQRGRTRLSPRRRVFGVFEARSAPRRCYLCASDPRRAPGPVVGFAGHSGSPVRVMLLAGLLLLLLSGLSVIW